MSRARDPRWLSALPALTVTVGLFGGGLLLAVAQSFGAFPAVGAAHFTAAAYGRVLGDPTFWSSLWLSLGLAGGATFCALLLGSLLALAVRRAAVGGAVPALLGLSLPVPHAVAALVTVGFFSQSGVLARLAHGLNPSLMPSAMPALVADPLGLGVLLELTFKETPFVTLAVLAALARLDTRLEDAARSLGAGRWARLRWVLWPAARPALVATGTLIFAFALSSYEVPLLLGPTAPAPLSVEAYRAFSDGDLTRRPTALVLSLLLALLGAALLWASLRERRRP